MMFSGDKAFVNSSEESHNSQSKKAQVLRLARSDPFLTVDEIARAVGTTSRYVRTSLSQAGVTLTELRRRFVRDLRRRLREEFGVEHAQPDDERRETVAVDANSSSTVSTRCLTVGQRTDADLASLLRVAPGTPLLEVSRVHLKGDEPLYVNQLLTTLHIAVTDKLPAADDTLHTLLVLAGESPELAVAKRTVDIVPAAEYIAEWLRVEGGHPILRSASLLVTPKAEPVAVEISYFDALRVRVELETTSRLPVRVIERASDQADQKCN